MAALAKVGGELRKQAARLVKEQESKGVCGVDVLGVVSAHRESDHRLERTLKGKKLDMRGRGGGVGGGGGGGGVKSKE